MDLAHKKILRALTLEMRHLLEGEWNGDSWTAGDLERRLRGLGVRQDGSVVPVEELSFLPAHDVAARTVIDAWLGLRLQSGASGEEAVAELVRETAWSWANRLLALRCMEARELLDDEVIVTKAVYAGRSMLHNRLVKKQPELAREEDGGLFFALAQAMAELAEPLPRAFDSQAPGIALRPSVAALRSCIALLSGTQAPHGQEPASDAVFQAPDALGWAYQYWNTEEKQRVFDRAAGKGSDRVRHKIERADIIPATQLYTEPYMVQFLVQNGLGGLWASMHPGTRLMEDWAYFVRDAERPEVPPRPVREITFLDPACGSGHFLLEAFDLFFAMYREEDRFAGKERDATAIVSDILTYNLHGLDIDERAVHIAEVALWMKAAEVTAAEGRRYPENARANLVATNVRLPREGGHLDAFLEQHPEDLPLREALQVVFEGLEHADELGALLLLDEPVEEALRKIRAKVEAEQTPAEVGGQTSLLGGGVHRGRPASAASWEDWRDDVLVRLREHFAQEARSADPVQAFFGRSVERALDVFGLLAQRYDVVAANPPYMGSKNMGPVLRRHVERYFKAGKRDLYAAFIFRGLSLLTKGGRLAIVAQTGWMFLRSYSDLRFLQQPDERGSGLLSETAIEGLVNLGPRAFTEITGEVVTASMFCLRRNQPKDDHAFPSVDVSSLRTPSEKAQALQGRRPAARVVRPLQASFVAIHRSPLCCWLRPRFLRLFAGRTVTDVGNVRQGLATADDGRFLRFTWEVPVGARRWFTFYKGGGYRKWDGLVNLVVDWEDGGARLRAFPRAVIRNPDAYFNAGWTYSLMSRGRMGVRRQAPPGVIGHKGPGIYLGDESLVSALNSRAFSHMMRAVSPNMAFEVETVSRGPLPLTPPAVDVGALLTTKSHLTATDPTERAFTAVADLPTLLAWCAKLHTLEGEAERAVMAAYELDEDDIAAVLADTGTPAGWLSDTVDEAARDRIHALFEAGPGATVEEENDDTDSDDEEDNDAPPDLATGRPIHPETFLEELCEKANVSPRAAWPVIQDGLAQGWRCPPEERRIAADRVTVLVLRLLGHRWPTQVEAGEPVPPWADDDGIIPLTSIPGEPPLIERLRERLVAEGISEATLSAALDLPLDQWLHTRFATHHTSQFKKRPVAWQVQSGPFTTRRAPAFAALLYCQKVGAETLASLRSQYVGPLLERRRQEQRTLAGAAERSSEQDNQLKELEVAVAELERFAEALVTIEREGFAATDLKTIAVQEAIQSLLQPLLVRWRDELVDGPLRGWAADGREVDESLATALHEAVESLPSQVGGWRSRVTAPPWGEQPPTDSTLRQAVLAATSTLLVQIRALLGTAVDGAFNQWMRAEREAARALGLRPPRFKREKALVEPLQRRIDGWDPDTQDLPPFIAALPLLDAWCGEPGRAPPATLDDFVRQESAWRPDINDGVRVNIAPLQRAGLLAADPLAAKDIEPAIADRAAWRADERRWVREGKLPRPGWWAEEGA